MAVASTSGNLEERLSLISQMLEEAVDLLRNTMSEVREEAKGEESDDHDSGRPDAGSDRWPG